jgi:hypothetical protein
MIYQLTLMMLAFAPGAGGIVVGIGCGLWGPFGFGDVAEVEADSIPDGGAAAHSVDEDVVFGEIGCGFRVFFFPASEAGFGGGFVGGLSDDDEWVFWGAADGWFACGNFNSRSSAFGEG